MLMNCVDVSNRNEIGQINIDKHKSSRAHPFITMSKGQIFDVRIYDMKRTVKQTMETLSRLD